MTSRSQHSGTSDGPRQSEGRITIVEDHALVGEVLTIALRMEGFAAVRLSFDHSYRDVAALLPLIRRTRPDVVLLDLHLGDQANGMRLVQPLVTEGAAVIVMTGSADPARWGEALALGARTVMSKTTPFNELLSTVRLVHEGVATMTTEERAVLVRAWQGERSEVREARTRLERLSRREAEVLAHLVDGWQVREIARHHVVSEATVRTQTKAILSKLEVASQLGAVHMVRRAQEDDERRAPRSGPGVDDLVRGRSRARGGT